MAKKNDLPPFTLEEAEKWLLWIENETTIERDTGYASRVILNNLFLALVKAKVIDGKAFLMNIKAQLDKIDGKNYKVATEAYLAELLCALNELELPDGREEDPVH